MANPESQSSQINDAAELLRETQRLFADAESLLSTLNSQVAESEATRATLAEAASAAQSKLSDITSAATTVLAARTQITDEQAVITTKSAHIQAAQEHADKVRVELDRSQTAAAQAATAAEGHSSRALTANEAAAEVLAAMRAQKASADTELAAVVAARDQAKAASAATKQLASKAEEIDERIAAYETALEDLRTQSAAQLDTITRLLPGATAAGLAHAFDDRRKTFLKPATQWQWLFVGSVGALVLLALTGLWNVYDAKTLLGWDELARMWLARLPIAAALVWLALYASRESALAKRLEEDYGYKAAIAASFQGFQKQMAEIGASAPEGSPLSKLCEDTLTTIGSPPGRIYDKHKLTITPGGELASVANDAIKPKV
jgi:chemotaxis protein histidine kinase CheA